MRKFRRILNIFLIIAAVFVGIYLVLCFGLPFLLNSKDYSGIISDAVKSQTNLDLVIRDYRIKVSPKLNLTVDAGNVQLFYPNKNQILDIKNVNLDFATFALLHRELKLEKVSAQSVQISTKLLKNGKFTLQEYLEKNYKEAESSQLKISDEIPSINVNSLLIKIKDEKTAQKFKLEAQNLKISNKLLTNNRKLSTSGAFFCGSGKIADFNLKLAFSDKLIKNFQPEPVQIPFSDFNRYKMNAKINADLTLSENAKLSGKINIDNFTMKSANGLMLPPSYFHFKFEKDKGEMDSEFFAARDEKALLNAKFALSGAKKIYLKCSTKKISLKNLKPVLISLAEMLNIKNNLSEFDADGYITSDFTVETDFKAMNSSGRLGVFKASLKHKSIPLKITEINADVDFSDNEVKINKSALLVNNQPVELSGKIDKNARGNLTLSANDLSLANLMNAFSFLKPSDKIAVKSGTLSFNAVLKGKLENASPKIDAIIKNFKADYAKDRLSIDKITTEVADASEKSLKGTLKAFGIKYKPEALPKNLIANDITGTFNEKDFNLNPSKFSYDKASVTVSGTVKDYKKTRDSKFSLYGTVDTAFLRSLLPAEIPIYSKGIIPIGASLTAKDGKADIQANALAMPDAYISPVLLKRAGNTLLHAELHLEKDLLKIKEISLNEPPAAVKLSQNIDTGRLNHLLTAKGEVKNFKKPVFNNFQVKIPQKLVFSANPVDSASVTGDLKLGGNCAAPEISGYLNLYEVKMKELYAGLIQILPAKSYIKVQADTLKAGNTFVDLTALLPADIAVSKKINNLNISAQNLDMENLVKLTAFLPSAKYAPGFEAPFEVLTGKLLIKSANINNLKLQNINSDLKISKNVLYLNNLRANAYGGNIAANIEHNLLYTSTKGKIQARSLQSAAAAADIFPVNMEISGRLDFDSDITMSGLEQNVQMKTLKGHADILVTNAQLGPLGRFEHFLHAQNLLSQKLIYASLNSAKRAIAPKNTGYVDSLKGVLRFNNGLVYLNPVTTAGPQMSMYITGVSNLITGDVDVQILGKVSPDVSDSVGVLGDITLKNVLDEHTSYGETIAKLFTSYNSELPQMDISKIPALTSKYQAETKNFRVIIAGNPESIKSIKSFTWVNPLGSMKELKTYTQSEKQQPQQEKPQIVQPAEPPETPSSTKGFLDSIPDDFH